MYAIPFLSILLYSSLTTAIIHQSLRRIIPLKIEVREGEEMELHLTDALDDEISCYVKTATLVDCNLKAEQPGSNCSDRIKYWPLNGRCGVIVTNVQKSDQGWWRLTSKNADNKKLVDATKVKVLDRYDAREPNVSIISGIQYSLDFQNVGQFCLVKHPYEETEVIVRHKCSVEQHFSSADDGEWFAIAGVHGQIEEVRKKKNVLIHKEELISGFNMSSDNKFLHLYCHVRAYRVNLKTCRFSKSEMNTVGLRLRDGLRKGRYSYFGNGLTKGECGLTIESPKEEDYGSWYCVVDVGSKELLSAIITVEKPAGEMLIKNESPRTWASTPAITALTHELNLECSASVPLSYCWFSRPDGLQYVNPLPPSENEEEHFGSMLDFIDKDLPSGKCSITLSNVNMSDNGEWTCHMGPQTLGLELTERILVRVTETPLAAVNKIVNVEKANKNVTLQCKTYPNAKALQYCRFLSPKGFGININEKITKHKPIIHNDVKYWYAGKTLYAGECGLVISSVNLDHVGEWTCAAKLEYHAQELMDRIQLLYTPESSTENMTARAATGIGLGVLAVFIVIGISIVYVAKKFSATEHISNWWHRTTNRASETQSFHLRATYSQRSTTSASSSSSTEL